MSEKITTEAAGKKVVEKKIIVQKVESHFAENGNLIVAVAYNPEEALVNDVLNPKTTRVLIEEYTFRGNGVYMIQRKDKAGHMIRWKLNVTVINFPGNKPSIRVDYEVN